MALVSTAFLTFIVPSQQMLSINSMLDYWLTKFPALFEFKIRMFALRWECLFGWVMVVAMNGGIVETKPNRVIEAKRKLTPHVEALLFDWKRLRERHLNIESMVNPIYLSISGRTTDLNVCKCIRMNQFFFNPTACAIKINHAQLTAPESLFDKIQIFPSLATASSFIEMTSATEKRFYFLFWQSKQPIHIHTYTHTHT